MLELATLNREMPIVAPCRLIGSKSDTAMRHFKLFCFPWTAGQRNHIVFAVPSTSVRL